MAEQAKEVESKEEDTSTQDASTEEQNEDTDGADVSDDSSTSSSSEESKPTVDYKAELEKEQAQRKKAEAAIVKMKKADKTESTNDEFEEDFSDDTLKKSDLEAMESRIIGQVAGNVAEETITTVSSNVDEQELIRYHYNNSIVKTGADRKAVLADIMKAKLLANAAKWEVENSELKESAISKNTAGKSGVGSNQARSKGSSDFDKLSDADKKFLKDRRVDAKTFKIKKNIIT